MKKSTFAVIVGTRGFFNPLLARDGRAVVLKKLAEMGHSVVVLGEEDSRYGCVETAQDSAACARLFAAHKNEIGGVIVTLPNFGDEIGVLESIRASGLNVPILVHAFDDEIDRMDLVHRRDAFCGKLSVCSNLHQAGIRFTNTKYHTTAVESRAFEEDILRFDRICRVYGGMKDVRIAQIGTRPGAFRTVRYSEKLLERSNITIVPADMSEILAKAEAVDDEARIAACIGESRAYAAIDCAEEACDAEAGLRRTAKLTLAVSDWMTENRCSAAAFQCWDSIQKNYHCASCLTMSMMGEKGIPFACETDVTGAVAMYALSLACDSPAALLDWNNSFGEDRDKCVCFHCSNYPKSFFGIEPTVGCLDILGASLGFENSFGALKGQVAPGQFTFAGIDTDDFTGSIDMYAGEGDFLDEPVDTVGSPAVCRIGNLQTLLARMCKNGFHHHVAMCRGNVADVLDEVFSNYFGWNVYRHR